MAILSRRLILLAILLEEQFINHTQINLRPNKQFFEHSAACSSVTIELLPALVPFAPLWHAALIFDKNVNLYMNYSYPSTMCESILAHSNVCISGIINNSCFIP